MTSTTKAANASHDSRLSDIDAVRGFLIILVVFGHITLHSQPWDNEWYGDARTLVYRFHMPAFLFLSGFIFYYSGKAILSLNKFKSFIANRAERLLIPYFCMVIIVIGGKLLAFQFIPVDTAPPSFLDGLLAVFGPPSESPVNSLWYLIVLFIYCFITPLLLMIPGVKIEYLFLIAIPLHFNDFTEYFYIRKSSMLYVFFLYGCLACKYQAAYLPFLDRYRPQLAAFGVTALVTSEFFPDSDYTAILVSFIVTPAIHSICRLDSVRNLAFLQFFSKYAMIIYLLNSICSGILKGLILKFSTWNGKAFLFWAPIMVASGLLTPIAIKKFLLDRSPYLSKLTN
jgi:peptidoglycan/LPS O-acetylase OafA/YrhL